jgi:hypothetical protein
MQSYTSLCKGSNTNTLTVLKTSCNVILMSWLASLAAYVRLEVDSLIRYKCIYFLYIYYTINTYLVTDLLLCHSLKKTHTHLTKGPGGLSPIRRGFALGFVNYKKGCTRLAAASDKVNQLIAHGRWFSPGTPASSITKTGRHDIAEILLKVALSTKNQINHTPCCSGGGTGENHRPWASNW